MNPINFISAFNIVSAFYRETGFEDLSETDAIEWIGQALEHIGCPEYCQLETAFVGVQNYKVTLPDNLFSILQIAKRIDNTPITASQLCSECNFSNPISSDDDYELTLPDPCGDPIPPYFNLIYYYFDITTPNTPWVHVASSQHSFLNAIECATPVELYNETSPEYTIKDGKIVFSFQEGYVAISYYKRKMDEEGYPYVPDEISVREALLKYMLYKYFSRLWYLGREGAERKMIKSEQDWHWYCKQAKNKAKNLTPDEVIKLSNYRNTLLPRRDDYRYFYNEFGRIDNRQYLQ